MSWSFSLQRALGCFFLIESCQKQNEIIISLSKAWTREFKDFKRSLMQNERQWMRPCLESPKVTQNPSRSRIFTLGVKMGKMKQKKPATKMFCGNKNNLLGDRGFPLSLPSATQLPESETATHRKSD